MTGTWFVNICSTSNLVSKGHLWNISTYMSASETRAGNQQKMIPRPKPISKVKSVNGIRSLTLPHSMTMFYPSCYHNMLGAA